LKKLKSGITTNKTRTTFWKAKRFVRTISLNGRSAVRKKRMSTKAPIATFHGQIDCPQLCPSGPRVRRIKACMSRAKITEARLNLRVSRPTPMPSSTNGATYPIQ
jgi:hypothetical protein